MEYRLWTLNAVTKHFESGDHWDFDVPGGHRLRMIAAQRDFGVNRPASELGVQTTKTQLMHEGSKVDEYWLPIPLKCFGAPEQFADKWLGHGPAKRELFDGIVGEYQSQFTQIDSYWTGAPYDPRTKMGTRKPLGLYDVLQHYSESPDVRNILVGYSEGGLVARYLAFIDEHLSRRPIIDGVITVHSPNAGSVFASAGNADKIVAGLLSVVLCGAGAGYDTVRALHESLIRTMPQDGGAQVLCWLADAARVGLADWAQRYADVLATETANLPAGDPADFEKRLWDVQRLRNMRGDTAILYTLHQWLSGLRADGAYAFRGLDVRDLDRPFSVLGALLAYPLTRAVHGAIVGWDDNPAGLVFPAVWDAVDNFAPFIKVRMSDISQAVREAMIVERAQLGRNARQIASLMGSFVHGAEAASWMIFDGEQGAQFRPGTIDARGHDFIIPAVYQLIPAPLGTSKSQFLGNFVFRGRTHASGVDACEPTVKMMLGLIAKRIAP